VFLDLMGVYPRRALSRRTYAIAGRSAEVRRRSLPNDFRVDALMVEDAEIGASLAEFVSSTMQRGV
jgi:hypothetical protein